jgi:O-6-methylguanine DNA methyltransferase
MSHIVVTLSTSLGPFTLAFDREETLLATAFGDARAVLSRLKKRRAFVDPSWEAITDERKTSAEIRSVLQQVRAYFAGEAISWRVQLAPAETPFQAEVRAELQRIRFGDTRSYGEIARTLGTSARAVGRANGANPVCVIVPCHRVVGADGSLTGFAFGEAIKQKLLALEGARAG